MLTTFINTLTSAEADALCGAGYGERSETRTNTRNGYRHRDFDTLDVAIPTGHRSERPGPPVSSSARPSLTVVGRTVRAGPRRPPAHARPE